MYAEEGGEGGRVTLVSLSCAGVAYACFSDGATDILRERSANNSLIDIRVSHLAEVLPVFFRSSFALDTHKPGRVVYLSGETRCSQRKKYNKKLHENDETKKKKRGKSVPPPPLTLLVLLFPFFKGVSLFVNRFFLRFGKREKGWKEVERNHCVRGGAWGVPFIPCEVG